MHLNVDAAEPSEFLGGYAVGSGPRGPPLQKTALSIEIGHVLRRDPDDPGATVGDIFHHAVGRQGFERFANGHLATPNASAIRCCRNHSPGRNSPSKMAVRKCSVTS